MTRRTGFQEVRDTVLRRIEDRVWPQGSLLPPEIELAAEFGCARATVNRALRELAEDGIVDRRRRGGTRVATDPVRHAKLQIPVVRQTVEAQGAAYRYGLVSRTELPCPAWLATRLALPEAAPILHVRSMHYADNAPFQFEDRWINIAAVPNVAEADFTTTGPNEWLLREVPFTEAEVSFMAVAADPELAEFLGSPAGAALFRMERTTWLRKEPVTFVRMTYHPGYRMTSAS